MRRLLAARNGVETWLLEEQGSVLKRCAPEGPWQQLVARAEQFRSLQDLRYCPGRPYGVAGFRSFRKDHSGCELELDFIEAAPFRGPHPQAETVALRLCDLLSEVHGRGQLHGDLSPGNVLIAEQDVPVLIDFGHQQTYLEGSVATLRYAAPERLGLLDRMVGPSSDVYSLCLLLSELWTGRAWIEGDSAAEILDRHTQSRLELVPLPEAVRQWLLGGLHLEPRRRYQDAAEMRSHWMRVWDGDRVVFTSFVGRQRELEAADELWQEAKRGQAGWMVVWGESGLGKTRFLQELSLRWSARILWGRAGPNLAPSSYEPLRSALTHLASADLKHDLEETSWHWLKQMFPCLETLHPGSLLELSLQSTSAYVASESAEALLRLGRALGFPGSPVLLILDDMQWADEQLWQLLAPWSQQRHGDVLVCLSLRPSRQLPRGLRVDRELVLPRLNRFEQTTLLEELLPGQVEQEWVAEMDAWAQGNPFFLLDLARVRQGGQTRSVSPMEASDPLRKAALVGRAFPRAMVSEAALQDAVKRRSLWVEGPTAYFAHDQIRDQLLEGVGKEQKRKWHAEIARDWCEGAEGRKGLHLWLAGRGQAALPWLLRGADRAMSAKDYSLAATLWDTSLKIREDAQTRLALISCRMASGQFELALADCNQALRLPSTPPVRLQLRQQQLQLVCGTGDNAQALPIVKKSLAELTILRKPLRFWRLTTDAESCQVLLRVLDEAVVLHIEAGEKMAFLSTIALWLFATARARDQRGQLLLATVCLVAQLLGKPLPGLYGYLKGKLPAVRDPVLRAFIRGRLAATNVEGPDESFRELQLCEPIFRISGDRHEYSSMILHFYWLGLSLGRLPEVRKLAWNNLARSQEDRNSSLLALSLAALAMSDLGGSEELLASLRGLEVATRPIALIHRAIALLHWEKDLRPAIDLLRRDFGGPLDPIVAWPWLATALRRQACQWSRLARRGRSQQFQEAERLAKLTTRRGERLPLFWLRALRERGLALLCQGREEEARSALQEALEKTVHLGNLLELHHLYQEFGQAARLLDWQEADELELRGTELAQRLGIGSTSRVEGIPARLRLMVEKARAVLRGESLELEADSSLGKAICASLRARQMQMDRQLELRAQLEQDSLRLREYSQDSSVGLAWVDSRGKITAHNQRYQTDREADERRPLRDGELAIQWPLGGTPWSAITRLQQSEFATLQGRWQRLQGFARRYGVEMGPLDPSKDLIRRVPDLNRLTDEQRAAALGVLREALTNARKHASGALVEVETRWDADRMILSIHDKGPGIRFDASSGFGLVAMRWRARLAGGVLRVENREGTRVTLEFPLPN